MMSKGATVKLHNWSPQAPPEFDSLEMKEYRNLIVEAVETIYAINEQTTVEPFKAEAVSHDQIYFYLKTFQEKFTKMKIIKKGEPKNA